MLLLLDIGEMGFGTDGVGGFAGNGGNSLAKRISGMRFFLSQFLPNSSNAACSNWCGVWYLIVRAGFSSSLSVLLQYTQLLDGSVDDLCSGNIKMPHFAHSNLSILQ